MKALKIAGVTFGALLGLVVIAIVIVALTFDPNDYKDYAQTWVEERTGRSLNIEGDIELSLFPWLAVQTGHVELGNAEGFGPEPFAAAQRISARVRLMPLVLRREFEIGTISTDALELDLAVAADGTNNWADLLGAANSQPPLPNEDTQANAADQSAALAGLDVEGIELRGASVIWREAGEPRYIVNELALSTGPIAPANPADLDIAADLLDVATQRTARIEMTTELTMHDGGAISAADSIIDFVIGDASGDTDAQGQAEIATLEFTPGEQLVTGAVQLSNTVTSPLSGGTLASELAWNALEFDLTEMNVAIEDLAAQAGDISTRWQLTGEDLGGESTVLRGSVVIDDSPLAAALEISGLELPQAIAREEPGRFSGSTTFVFEPTVGDVELSNFDLNVFGMNVSVQQAVLRGDILSAQIDVPAFQPNDALRRIIAAYAPDTFDTSVLDTVALRASLFGTPEDFSVTEMNIAALGIELTGQLEVQPGGAGLSIGGNISSNRFSTEQIFALAGELLPESITPATTGSVALAGQFAWNPARSTLAMRDIRLEAFGMRGSGEMTLNDVDSSPQAIGSIQLDELDPRDLLNRFSLAVPQTSDSTALRSAVVSAGFAISSDNAVFEELTINLDDSQITGSFNVSNFSDPFYRFTLSADRLNVDRYLPPQEAPGADSQAADNGERRAGDIELSNEALSAVNIDANARVGQLRIAGMDFSNVATSMIVGEGRMLLDSAHADLYGGTFDGRFHVDASADVPTMLMQGSAADLQLTPLITALAESANFSGTGSFEIDLTGRGPTITDNLRSASGTMGFALLNGAIEGFNVDKTLCRAFNNLRGNPAPREEPDRSAYESIQGSATVTNGIAASNDLVATVGSVQVRGTGTLALADQVMDYDLEARLLRAVPIGGCEEMGRIVNLDFPLEVKGPLASPDIAPDYNEVVRRVLEDRIRDEVRDRLLESIFD